jgi:hypothetical protein
VRFAMTKPGSCFLLLLVGLSTPTQAQQIRIGDIEYFGTKGVDVSRVKSSLPIHEGDELTYDALPDLITRVKNSVEVSSGKQPTDVETVCCDVHDNWIIYIGLRGQNLETFHYKSPPNTSISLPTEAVDLYHRSMDLIFESVHKQAAEDRSKGYALALYPPLRAKQLAMRDYAIHNVALIRRVLNESSDAEQRTVAAQLLGYANHDKLQIDTLVKASRDSDDGVRNNAVRALGVLAESRPAIANEIPAKEFVSLLNSGNWKDRNKGGYVLGILTIRRNPRLLKLLRRQASESLLEMARWREFGHAESARFILGRIAGIEENRLRELVANDLQTIVNSFSNSRP